ncbi:Stp1/IreP family PP2C-type Ser/Thr phosphatase [Lactobacillus selangorensis]|uniref:Stp1/IreP family PP2C-type Ser/Thr phosphatase n=1 Tax=Lactobacillus selangorensis TaxID=81857 RepID=UPI00070F6410|nr:Stp1/IreP family PP2C-type Ser/Thr phosphatase [Lactobacillus selangorensis]
MEIAYQTDVGQKRESNQDYVGTFLNKGGARFAIVADGMGGHRGGDVASEMAVSHIGYHFEQTTSTDVEELIKWLVVELQNENQQIIDASEEYADLMGMGTTMVAVILVDHKFVVANIGDSRAYLYRSDRLKQLTEDHSLVNELVKQGEISPEDARNHPQKNIITRSLGISTDVDADVTIYELAENDLLLLCTDGLTNMMTDRQIAMILASPEDITEKCKALVKVANQAGGLDNITALLIHETQQAVND